MATTRDIELADRAGRGGAGGPGKLEGDVLGFVPPLDPKEIADARALLARRGDDDLGPMLGLD